MGDQILTRMPLSKRIPVEIRRPSIVTWNRLEPRPRTDQFERSLRAEVRDALWMLTRQWQVGEFRGEDAGSAIFAKVQIETTRITRFAVRDLPASAYDASLPLETQVERETPEMDLGLRLQLGQHWFRLLAQKGLGNTYRELYRKAYPIEIPAQSMAEAELFSNRLAWGVRAAAAGRLMDGGDFFEDLVTGAVNAEDVTADGLSVDAGDRSPIAEAAVDFIAYFRRLFSLPGENEDAWIPERLEYQFACSAPEPGGGMTVLAAEEYFQGHLDWYSFDIARREHLALAEGQTLDEDVIRTHTFTFLPTEARFGGMPNTRWWEFEDRKINFGEIDAHTTDLGTLLLVEQGLVYGNDWLVTPFVAPAGSLCEVKAVVVKDVFGDRTLVLPAGRGQDDSWQRWAMFNLSVEGVGGAADTRLFLPPATPHLLEGPPVEKVNLLRDEMANFVWGVEALLPSGLGHGMDGYEAALDLARYLRSLASPPAPPMPIDTGALVRYLMATTVPENWIPFIPVHVPGQNREVQLQRAAMPRAIPGVPVVPVRPRSQILLPRGTEAAPYFIFEEEVPRTGAIVTRSFQRARWSDGSTHLWLGRRKGSGRGEGSSGLTFDRIEPTDVG